MKFFRKWTYKDRTIYRIGWLMVSWHTDWSETDKKVNKALENAKLSDRIEAGQ